MDGVNLTTMYLSCAQNMEELRPGKGMGHILPEALKEAGVGKIYAYATHTENSILDREKGTLIKSLENNTVERLFTTNSLFSGKHDKITVLEV